jgi:hypothetical protein
MSKKAIVDFIPVQGSWTPASLTGLVAWYKADAGVYKDLGTTLAVNNDTVEQWNDQSGNGYNLTQTSAGTRGTYLTNGFDPAYGSGGFKTISMQGKWMISGTNALALSSSTLLSCFICGNLTNNGSNESALTYVGSGQANDYNNTASGRIIASTSPSTIGAYCSAPRGTAPYIQNADGVVGMIYSGTVDNAYYNNVAGSNDSYTPAWGSSGTLLVAGNYTGSAGSAGMSGYYSEIVLVSGAIGSSDRTSLQSYLRTKWGLSNFYLTSASAPSPLVASASSYYSSNDLYTAWRAFDGAYTDFWNSGNGSLPEWIKLDAGAAFLLTRYTLTARTPSNHYWAAWILEGSPDNSSWTQVDSQSGQTFSNGQTKSYTLGTPSSYRYWRWTISSSQSGTYAEMCMIGMY